MPPPKDLASRPPEYHRAVATIWIRLLGSFPIVFAIVSSILLVRWRAPDGSHATTAMWQVPIVCTLVGIVVWLLSASLARFITRHREP